MSHTPVVGLRQWIWRAFSQSALIPLLLVETLLIIIYLFTNNSIRDSQIEYLRGNALTTLQSSAQVETRVIDEQLGHIDSLTELYRNLVIQALRKPAESHHNNLALSQDGVRYSPIDEGGAAIFYSNITPAARQDLDKVARLSSLDPIMKEFKEHNSLVAALYFNSWDSLNHIYPWFLTPEQYPHNMVIPNYNFYYLADAAHNPSEKVVWTDVYLDPAGQGWMMSSVAPVYSNRFLEGVVGIDITVTGILEHIRGLDVPWNGFAVLVSNDLKIMALPEAGEKIFGLNELTSHQYKDTVRSELFKPIDFDLNQRKDTRELAAQIIKRATGVERVTLNGEAHLIAWSNIPETNWHLLTVATEANVFSQTNMLANRYKNIGLLLIAGLIVFYAIFFSFMWHRAQKLSLTLRKPIAGIAQMMAQIGLGNWSPEKVNSNIRELQEMANHTAHIGEQLAESESNRLAIQRRLELVLESVTESIWERDYRGNTIKLRGRMSQRFGLSGEIINEDEFYARIHPDDLKNVKAKHQSALHSHESSYASEYRFADAKGQYHWILSRGRVLERNPATGKTLLLAGTHMDINQLKQVEEELRQAIIDATAASNAKSRFISSMSHELRTPLNAIQGFTQLLQLQNPDINTSGSDCINEILAACRHLSQLVGDLLDLSSIQIEKAQLEMQTIDIREVMTECTNMMGPEILNNKLQLHLSMPPEAIWVQADARRLRQILLNLLSNSIKYNKPNGSITLGYSLTATTVKLEVQDTGIGIAPELQHAAFTPFERLGWENSTIQGTGVGLTLCQELAIMMQGKMGFSSQLNIGSTFWLELPSVSFQGLLIKPVDADELYQQLTPLLNEPHNPGTRNHA